MVSSMVSSVHWNCQMKVPCVGFKLSVGKMVLFNFSAVVVVAGGF